jgi:predicted amidohydrolase YtcJ
VKAPVQGGVHDHHIHLFATAAALSSVRCGPPQVRDRAGLARALAAARPDARGWVRGVGYHESVSGELDRAALDRLRGDVPIRVQHRSGQLWVLNSRALATLGLEGEAALPAGVERDGSGRPTGRLYRCDTWLRQRLGPDSPPSLAEVGRRLTQIGVTAVTDATATNGPAELAAFAAARARGELPQRIVLMGTLELSACNPLPGIEIGALKIHLTEAELPPLAGTIDLVRAAHARGRAAAIHCTTRAELVFALAVFEAAGVRPGDRLEHVHVAPPECVAWIARLGLTVCTNPGLVAERRADWLEAVEPADRPWLAPAGALRAAGVPLLVGSDAPWGPIPG